MTTCTAATATAAMALLVAIIHLAATLRENRRQRAYRDALMRGDRTARDRLMGLEP